MTITRCSWAGSDPLYIDYHDKEWGVPERDPGKLFELLLLEGAQAGLSWITVLRKREHYRKVYDGFDIQRIARWDDAKRQALLADPGIIRNRAKVEAATLNARAWLEMEEAGVDPAQWLWRFVDGKPLQREVGGMAGLPASTPVSDAMSKALKARGFKFVGSTICYAFMQASGMVNDHFASCFRCREVAMLGR
ncbi:DNA-3-methyladenine glycosylase I [Azoarcus sp. TTM-91]|uniref:DNA-3-methyladenine glycosylase I n=1 Tax=Azoarcus sp. TTM-91 TaxID=2691581 RepID=UPI00145CF382|nr:DNA-3-methyladenine glycosylase I [Azoarcus sp. TTM-91]NMG36083.1 DNA-3-methyladenine glycosylase I [Azoarcus sp. TTM-91]